MVRRRLKFICSLLLVSMALTWSAECRSDEKNSPDSLASRLRDGASQVTKEGARRVGSPLQTIAVLSAMQMADDLASKEFQNHFKEFLKTRSPEAYEKARSDLAKILESAPEKFKQTGASTDLWIKILGTGIGHVPLTALERHLLFGKSLPPEIQKQIESLGLDAKTKEGAIRHEQFRRQALSQVVMRHFLHYASWLPWEISGAWYEMAVEDYRKRLEHNPSIYKKINEKRMQDITEVLMDPDLRDEFIKSMLNVIKNSETVSAGLAKATRRWVNLETLGTFEAISLGGRAGGAVGGWAGRAVGARIGSAIGGRIGGAIGALSGPTGILVGSLLGTAGGYFLYHVSGSSEFLEKVNDATLEKGLREYAEARTTGDLFGTYASLKTLIEKDKSHQKENPGGFRFPPPRSVDTHYRYDPDTEFHRTLKTITRTLAQPEMATLIEADQQLRCGKENTDAVIQSYLRSLALNKKKFLPTLADYIPVTAHQEHLLHLLTDMMTLQNVKNAILEYTLQKTWEYSQTQVALEKIKSTPEINWAQFRLELPDSKLDPSDPDSPLSPHLADFTKPVAIAIYINELEAILENEPILKTRVQNKRLIDWALKRETDLKQHDAEIQKVLEKSGKQNHGFLRRQDLIKALSEDTEGRKSIPGLDQPDLPPYTGMTEADLKKLVIEAAAPFKAEFEKNKTQAKQILQALKTDTASFANRESDFKKKFPDLPPDTVKGLLEFEDLKNELFSYLQSLEKKIDACGQFECDPSRECALNSRRTDCNKAIQNRKEKTRKLLVALQGDEKNPDSGLFGWNEAGYEFLFLKSRLLDKFANDYTEETLLEAHQEFFQKKEQILAHNQQAQTEAIGTQVNEEWLQETGKAPDLEDSEYFLFYLKRSQELHLAIEKAKFRKFE